MSCAALAQFDAGSCIDGRLTSAWNWGSKIEKKDYYHIFKICGFVGALPAFGAQAAPFFFMSLYPKHISQHSAAFAWL